MWWNRHSGVSFFIFTSADINRRKVLYLESLFHSLQKVLSSSFCCCMHRFLSSKSWVLLLPKTTRSLLNRFCEKCWSLDAEIGFSSATRASVLIYKVSLGARVEQQSLWWSYNVASRISDKSTRYPGSVLGFCLPGILSEVLWNGCMSVTLEKSLVSDEKSELMFGFLQETNPPTFADQVDQLFVHQPQRSNINI